MTTTKKKETTTLEKQVEAWKNEHGEIHKISVKVKDGDVAVGYLKPIPREVTARAMSMYSQQKLVETGDFIINNCWLGGDERIRQDEKVSLAAAVEANSLVEFLEASVEKL